MLKHNGSPILNTLIIHFDMNNNKNNDTLKF